MKKILTYYGQPILDVVKGISAGKQVDFGVFRDRNPDRDWSELQQVNLTTDRGLKEIELNDVMRKTFIEDLAYAYGRDTKIFGEKIKEFNLI